MLSRLYRSLIPNSPRTNNLSDYSLYMNIYASTHSNNYLEFSCYRKKSPPDSLNGGCTFYNCWQRRSSIFHSSSSKYFFLLFLTLGPQRAFSRDVQYYDLDMFQHTCCNVLLLYRHTTKSSGTQPQRQDAIDRDICYCHFLVREHLHSSYLNSIASTAVQCLAKAVLAPSISSLPKRTFGRDRAKAR